MLPRSGLAARHGIALVNAPGLIDAGYRGELRVLLLNTDRAEAFEIEPGDRIAQLVIAPVASPEFVEASELSGVGARRGRIRLLGRRLSEQMSQRDIDVILASYEAFNSGDLDAAMDAFAPEIEWNVPPILPDAQVYHGHEGVKQFWIGWQETFDDFRVEIDETIDAGEQIVVMAKIKRPWPRQRDRRRHAQLRPDLDDARWQWRCTSK